MPSESCERSATRKHGALRLLGSEMRQPCIANVRTCFFCYPALFFFQAVGSTRLTQEADMARPIAPTPALRGKDAERFVAAAKNPKPFEPPKVENSEALEAIKQRLLAREQK